MKVKKIKLKKSEGKFREILLNISNPFAQAVSEGEKQDQEIIKYSPRSLIFYKDYNSGVCYNK